jgi:ABC-2 type transport system permease protein
LQVVVAAQLRTAWLLAAVTLALLTIAPRFTPMAWGVLVGFITVYLLGSLSGLRQCSISNHSRTSSR